MIPFLLIGAGLAAYHNSFTGAFLLDDEARIGLSPQIRQLWPPWEAMAQSSRPVVQLSLAVNYALGGLNVWGYHAFNLAVHLLAGLVLFGIVRRMLDSGRLQGRYGRAAPWLAGAVAVVWTVHPLQTESVTYVIQRAESLMGLCLLLTLYCGIRGAGSPHPRRWYLAAVVACGLGMGSKEVMVVAPLVVLLYDRVFMAGSFTEIFRRRWGLYAGLAATWLILGAVLATSRAEDQVVLVTGLTPWRYALTQFGVIVHYLRLSVWPRPLILDYAWPLAESVSSVVPWAAVVLALLGGTVLALYRQAWAGFWGAWFFLILAPTSSILPIADVAFEHRMYLPLAAVVVLGVIGGHEALERGLRRPAAPEALRRWLGAGVVAVVIVVLASTTARRNEDYRSDIAMWRDTVAKRPSNPRAHNNLGVVLNRAGKPAEAIPHFSEALRLKADYVDPHVNLGAALFDQGRIDEAVAHYAEALRINPNYALAHKTLGDALARQGRVEQAIAHYAEALRLHPDSALAHNTHNNLGDALVRQGKVEQAIAHYAEALRLNPDSAVARINLGAALTNSGNLAQAVAYYAEAIRLNPNLPEAHYNLGTTLARQGRVEQAVAQYTEALRLNPRYAAAHKDLAILMANQGKVGEAIAHYSEALRLNPDDAVAHNNLGAVLSSQGKLGDAGLHYAEAIRINPNYAEAQNNLGSTLARQGKFEEAIPHFAEALRLNPDFVAARNNLGAALARQGKPKVGVAR